MNALVIGASSGIGRELSRQLADRGARLFLVSSSVEDLKPLQSDFQLRYNATVIAHGFDLQHGKVVDLMRAVEDCSFDVDHLFCIAGVSHIEADFHGLDPERLDQIIQVNYYKPIQIVQMLLPRMNASNFFNVVLIGSVAAARARPRNTVYASAKRGLEFYSEGLFHHFSGSRVRIQSYRVGYVDTNMSFESRSILPKISSEKAAAAIIRNIGAHFHGRYLPGWWGCIMLIYIMIPDMVMTRLPILLKMLANKKK